MSINGGMLQEARRRRWTQGDLHDIMAASKATGVNPAWIAGMTSAETGGGCSSRAFNRRLVKRNAKRYNEDYAALRKAGIIDSSKPVYSDHRKDNKPNGSYFHRAFQIAPKTAIAVTAWGKYQVMGGHLLKLGGLPTKSPGGDPSGIVNEFFNNPCEVSVRLFESWIRSAGPSFRRTANRAIRLGRRSDFATTVDRYLGAPKDKYINIVMRNSRAFIRDYPELMAGFESGDIQVPSYERVKLDGTKVYVLGDSNTVAHKNYWTAWSKKNMPASRINFEAKSGLSIPAITQQLQGIDPKTAKTIIIGSLGGNDAQGLKNGNFEAELSPDGPYYQGVIIPLIKELRRFQNGGTKIVFFGLPFGRRDGKTPRINDKREAARFAMDAALAIAAASHGIPYRSVFEATRAIKGSKGGVHYSGGRRKAYRDLLATLTGGEQPSSEEEIAYARGGSGRSLGSGPLFLSSYKDIKRAGLKFDLFYTDLEKAFGPDYEKKVLPKHGKDRVFGPEHYAALVALTRATKNQFYASLINMKEKRKEDVQIAKAEDKAERSIEKEVEELVADLESSRAIAEQTEPYQRAVKKDHRKRKKRLTGKGKNTYNVGGKMKRLSYKRAKSAAAGFGGS